MVVGIAAYYFNTLALLFLFFFRILYIVNAGWRSLIERVDVAKKRRPQVGQKKRNVFRYPLEMLSGRKAWMRRIAYVFT